MSAELLAMEQAAKSAGIIQKDCFGKVLKIVRKEGDNEISTNIDLACQDSIVKVLRSQFPDYTIFSEEAKGCRVLFEGNENKFVIDPLDGTENFASFIPEYGVSITLFKGTEPLAAVTYLPEPDLLITCERGKGIYTSKTPVFSPSRKPLLALGMKMEGGILDKLREEENFPYSKYGIRIMAAATVNYAYLALGSFDAVITPGHRWYDFAQGLVYVPELGGEITQITLGDSRPLSIENDNVLVVAARDKELHKKIIEALKS